LTIAPATVELLLDIPADLGACAERVRGVHAGAELAAGSWRMYAEAAGQVLVDVKARLRGQKGKYTKFVVETCGIPETTGRLYARCYRNRDKLSDEMTLSEARDHIASKTATGYRFEGTLARDFLVPPLSVIDQTAEYYIKLKPRWLAMGATAPLVNVLKPAYGGDDSSAFCPVLAEIAYRWFCPADGQVVDPYGGGRERGCVAHVLGRRYWGSEIRPEQVAANNLAMFGPEWVIGDARDAVPSAPDADFIFSCPPYGDLEVYSKLPGDLSNMRPDAFVAAYFDIIAKAAAKLKPDSFAAFVVGNARKANGTRLDLHTITTNAFEAAGMEPWAEIILRPPIHNSRLRARRSMDASRIPASAHQSLLVYAKL
jgi:hypothetical protein